MIQAYNHMIENYHSKQLGHARVHKNDELKKLYEKIIKSGSNTGVYKFKLSKENQLFLLGIKESALTIRAKLHEIHGPDWVGYHAKSLWVSNKEIIEAALLATPEEHIPEKLEVQIDQLAKAQMNQGKSLYERSMDLNRGIYDFRIEVRDKVYDLNFHQLDKSSNFDTMQRLASYINEEVPEVDARVVEDENNTYKRLVIEDKLTGKMNDRNFVLEESELYREGLVETFDLNHMKQEPQNAQFTINGIHRESPFNSFCIENVISITLKNVTREPIELKIVRNVQVVLEEVDTVLDGYNEVIKLAENYQMENGRSYSATRLIHELKKITKQNREELEECGISVCENGYLERDPQLSLKSLENGTMDELLAKENGFIASLVKKSEKIAINPLDYLDKIIVTYPNHKGKVNPYLTSVYSGLFFNSYC